MSSIDKSNYIIDLGWIQDEKTGFVGVTKLPIIKGEEKIRNHVNKNVNELMKKINLITAEAFSLQKEKPTVFEKMLSNKEFKETKFGNNSFEGVVHWNPTKLKEILKDYKVEDVDGQLKNLN